jgi:calcineurin-like phosphoesterase family protein
LRTAKENGFNTQEELIVDRWNKAVKPEDTVLILGDYAFNGITPYTEKLNGRKVLIRGNHDKSADNAYINAGFTSVIHGVVHNASNQCTWVCDNGDPYISACSICMGGVRIFFSHYPIDYYEDYHKRVRVDHLTPRIQKLSTIAKTTGVMINVHGHTHSNIVPDKDVKYLNVSCECIDYTPIKIGALLEAAGVT